MLRGFMREDDPRMTAVPLGETASMAAGAADVAVAEVPPCQSVCPAQA